MVCHVADKSKAKPAWGGGGASLLQGDVAVLLPRVGDALGGETLKVLADQTPRLARLDDGVDVSLLRGLLRGAELALVLRRLLHELLRRGATVDDLARTRRAHDRDLGRRPGVVHVSTDVLRAHDVVRTAVRLARDDGDLRDGRLAVGVQQLGAVADDAVPLLVRARQEARHVDKGDDRDVEGVGEADEAGSLGRRVDVEHTGVELRLGGNDGDRPALHAGEARDDVLRELRLHLVEAALVGHGVHHGQHVVGLRGLGRDHLVQHRAVAVTAVVALEHRRLLLVVEGQVRVERAQLLQRLQLVDERAVRHAALRLVRRRTAELLLRHVLVRHRLHDVGARHEHERVVLHHEREVRERRRVHGAARARAHDDGDLRHDAGRERVPQEDVGVAGEGRDALLDARAAGVVEADHGDADVHGLVHDLAHLGGVRAAHGPAEHREVLREQVHGPAVDETGARHQTVAGRLLLVQAEVVAVVRHRRIALTERAGVAEQVNALPRGELTPSVLLVHSSAGGPPPSNSPQHCAFVVGDAGGAIPMKYRYCRDR
eukprot:Rhum_TRINITY_DN14614_c11_g10::Rhum_TRINITY_DN14614_c11_g10_i1::g.104369::m.104369